MATRDSLTRSDSSSSQWIIPAQAELNTDGPDDHIRDQRRLRHLSSVLIRNLTLNPRRDELSSLLQGPAKPSACGSGPARAQDDTDLLFRSVQKRRGRASSSASMGSFNSGTGRTIPEEWRGRAEGNDAVDSGSGAQTPTASSGGDASSTRSRTRPRKTSAASTLIREEVEPTSPTSAPSPFAGPPSPSLEHTIDLSNPESPALRKRSASRASATSALSAGTSTSTSTIRQSTPRLGHQEGSGSFSPHQTAPKLPPASSTASRTFHAAGSEAQLAKEKARRAEILRRRLVDSFISMELVAAAPTSHEGDQLRTGRRRAPTVGGAASLRGRLVRSDSASSSLSPGGATGPTTGWTSPKKRPSRSRTYSSPVAPSSSSLASTAPSTTTSSPAPFFVSAPVCGTMHPNFAVDRDGFTIRTSCSTDNSAPPDLDDDAQLDQWEGLRQSRVLVKVWTRGGELEGKGKGKEQEADWKLLVEWDVELDGLVSLGRDPSAFPPLPPNTLVFHLSSSDEYYTAPLPSRRRSRTHSHRVGLRNGLGSLSDGDIEEDERSDESCCSSEDSEEETGNQSDPGAAGTSSFRSRKSSGGAARRRTDLLHGRGQTRADREAEEARKRRALVEKSVRETRMVRASNGADISRLIALEHELESTRRSIVDLKQTLSEALCGDGPQQGLSRLERERNETVDRVEDLECVEEDMKEDLDEARRALSRRRDALRDRRGRLKTAEELSVTRRAALNTSLTEVVDDESTCATIRQSSQTRRTQLITLLSHIFPVDPYTPKKPSATSPAEPTLLFSILSLPLPNSTYPPSALAAEIVSSALGYTAQVVSTLAAYLGVPLHYPIKCLGSRSAVVDLISMMRGPRAFPLYFKGVDRYRFDYAVFLLNKNIEQLMYSQGLTVIDLRNTLPNLKSLILALSFDPSHRDFSASTLAAPPPLFNLDTSVESTTTASIDSSDFPTGPAARAGSDPTMPNDEAPEATEGDVPPLPTTIIDSTASPRSASPAPTVTSLRSNGTANGSANPAPTTDSAPTTSGPDEMLRNGHSSYQARPSEKVKVKPSTGRSPTSTKPKLSGRSTLVAEEAKEALLRGTKGTAAVRTKGDGTARKSSGSRIASSLWSAVGYGES